MLNSFNLVYDELTEEQPMNNHIPVNLGIKSDGAPLICDLYTEKNILITQNTGAAGVDLLDSVIESLTTKFNAQQCQMVIISPNGVDHTKWQALPHLVHPIITLADKKDWNINSLKQQVQEIKNRHSILRQKSNTQFIPRIIIISEFYPFTTYDKYAAQKHIECITKYGPDVNVYLVLRTVHISEKTFTDIQKLFPTRISFRAVSKSDSIHMLGIDGAEHLATYDTALFCNKTNTPVKFKVNFTI